MNCQFQFQDGIYICSQCGFSTNIPNLNKNCSSSTKTQLVTTVEVVEMPSLLRRTFNFTKAAISHIVQGNPTCSQEEIDRRLNICKECPLFKKYTEDPVTGVCMHKNCGCNISDIHRYLNKLAWQDQKCPLDKW